MLTGFENITHDLTDEEMKLVPVFIKGFQDKIGPSKAVTNKVIVERLGKKYKISDARVRKIINHIRNHNLVPGLVASSQGYYVTRDPEELRRYIESLDGRESEIRRIKNTMKQYLKAILNKGQTVLYQ